MRRAAHGVPPPRTPMRPRSPRKDARPHAARPARTRWAAACLLALLSLPGRTSVAQPAPVSAPGSSLYSKYVDKTLPGSVPTDNRVFDAHACADVRTHDIEKVSTA